MNLLHHNNVVLVSQFLYILREKRIHCQAKRITLVLSLLLLFALLFCALLWFPSFFTSRACACRRRRQNRRRRRRNLLPRQHISPAKEERGMRRESVGMSNARAHRRRRRNRR